MSRTENTVNVGRSFFNFSVLKCLLIGASSGVLIILSFGIVFAVITTFRDVPEVLITPLVIASCTLGVFCASFISGFMIRKKGIAIGVIIGMLYYLLIAFVGLASPSQEFGVIAIIKLMFMLTASAIGGIVGVNVKRK